MYSLFFVSLAGFFAQLVDGSMGMAFGVTGTSLLLLFGYLPATASAIIHFAELVTTATSGLAHHKFGNVDRKILFKVALPGSLGAFAGAYLLSTVDLGWAKPWTASVLLILGLLVIYKFLRNKISKELRSAKKRWLVPLGFFGGLIDSTGGGGWGPVVTTSLTLSRVLEPRKAIGTTNTAEFAVAGSASLGFVLGLGLSEIPLIPTLALIIGGIFAAPIAANLVRKIPQRPLGVAIGVIIVLLNTYQLMQFIK